MTGLDIGCMDPRLLLSMWRMLAQLDGVTPFKSTLPHPFSDRMQRASDHEIYLNRQANKNADPFFQTRAAVEAAGAQKFFMASAGLADITGAALTEKPGKFAIGFFSDTMNSVFSLATRLAKMSTRGVEGESVFDQAFAVTNAVADVYLTSEGLKGLATGAGKLGGHFTAGAEALARVSQEQLVPAYAVESAPVGYVPDEIMTQSGLMMAKSEDGIAGHTLKNMKPRENEQLPSIKEPMSDGLTENQAVGILLVFLAAVDGALIIYDKQRNDRLDSLKMQRAQADAEFMQQWAREREQEAIWMKKMQEHAELQRSLSSSLMQLNFHQFEYETLGVLTFGAVFCVYPLLPPLPCKENCLITYGHSSATGYTDSSGGYHSDSSLFGR